MTSLPGRIPNAATTDAAFRDRIDRVNERIARAAIRAGRRPDEVRLLAVTKTVPVDRIREAAAHGLRLFGENFVQEAREKIPAVAASAPGHGLEFHLIGHLQANKARFCPPLFSVIQTVDSLRIAQELSRVASKHPHTLPLRVLVEVNLSADGSRPGAAPDEALELCASLATRAPTLVLEGLMGVAPQEAADDAAVARSAFRRLRALWDGLPASQRITLSMGMSADFEVAIEEGSTMVRIGTALFGERLPSR